MSKTIAVTGGCGFIGHTLTTSLLDFGHRVRVLDAMWFGYYLPKRDKLYAASKGKGATLNGVPIHATAQPALGEAKVLAARPVMHSDLWRNKAPDFKLGYRPSLAYRLALVAQGRFDAMLTLRPTWEWDIAAGDILQREAGAVCSDRTGAPLRFNNPVPKLDGVVGTNPALHRQVINAHA